MTKALCDYKNHVYRIKDVKMYTYQGFGAMWPVERPTGVKRIRVTCPVCGRRMWSSISTCHDGCCEIHSVPPHKPKGWWKRGKKKEAKSRERRSDIHRGFRAN